MVVNPAPRRKARIRRALHSRLPAWFARHRRHLPWRRTRDPYLVLVSEAMLQQTRVVTVVPYFERWQKTFPTLRSLARARLSQVLTLWAGLGYYGRARHLHRAARIIVRRHGGRVPSDPSVLQTLPGVGRYTAGAVASIGFGRPEPVLDGNVIRVLTRLFGMSADTSRAATRQRLWRLAAELVPRRDAGRHNQALMELGALVCVPGRPHCPRCPLKGVCRARAQGRAARLPVRGRRPPVRDERQLAVLLRCGSRVWLQQNRPGELMAGLWRFPRCGCRRELRSRFGINGQGPLGTITHTVMNRRITVQAYEKIVSRETFPRETRSGGRWVRRKDLSRLPLPAADRRLAALLG